MLTFLLAVLALGLLIIVHEWGHFAVARLCGMRVDRFSIGFGPAILRRVWGETTFQIGAVPLGGYVQIAGMMPEDENIDPSDPRAYPNRPAWQRAATIAAGPLVNYVFAVLLLIGLNWLIGVPGTMAEQVLDNRPAAQAGIQAGDQILKIGQRPIVDYSQVLSTVERSQGKPLTFEVVRKGQHLLIPVTPQKDESGGYKIGVVLRHTDERQRQGFFTAAEQGLLQPVTMTWLQIQGFVEVFRGKQKMDFKSPVYIVRMMKQQIGLGLARGIEIVAIISTLLGFFNLLPLPALDGGRLMFLGWEIITRRPVNQRVEQIVHFIGMMLLLGLLLILVVKDVRDWIFGTG